MPPFKLNVNPDPPVAVTVILPSVVAGPVGGLAFPVTATVTEAHGLGGMGSLPPLLLQALMINTSTIIPNVNRQIADLFCMRLVFVL